MSVDSERNVEAGVSRGNLDRMPFELANLYQRNPCQQCTAADVNITFTL